MVGGVVHSIFAMGGHLEVVVKDNNDYTAVTLACNHNSERIQCGDTLWWHGNHVFWSRRNNAEISDIKIPRIGYSRRVPTED